jgi:DNA polymerase-3 subunit alpha
MKQELEIFGFYLSNHPVTDYKLKYNNHIDLQAIGKYFDKAIELIIYIDKIKEVATKNNRFMCFITGSDETSSIDIILFPDTYENYSDLKEGDFIRLKGRVEKRYDKFQVIVNEIIEVINE